MDFKKLEKNKFYKSWFKNAWTYVIGAILLSVFQIVTLATTGNPWGVSGAFANWGAWLYRAVGGNVDKWYYFSTPGAQATLNGGFLNDPGSIRNLGIILGALMATLLASQFKIKKIKSKKQVVAAIIGGLLMGYGARISFGCNIGALYSGIASLSLSGWVFGLFLFLGAMIGSKLLVKFFM
ncbi:YeeE/YedE thiosulfate transporter family protein [Clostridium sp. JNZ J1-5]|nr:YeeE/YedE thiosulfate transporter family protein [Clostridium sp.]